MADLIGKKRWLRQRRSERIELNVPVVVHRLPGEGPRFSERTHTLKVSAHGALMALAGLIAVRQRLLLQNVASGEQQECRVISVEANPMGPMKVAVEFTCPAPGFWHIAYPPSDWKSAS
jgi:hypothetical protein